MHPTPLNFEKDYMAKPPHMFPLILQAHPYDANHLITSSSGVTLAHVIRFIEKGPITPITTYKSQMQGEKFQELMANSHHCLKYVNGHKALHKIEEKKYRERVPCFVVTYLTEQFCTTGSN